MAKDGDSEFTRLGSHPYRDMRHIMRRHSIIQKLAMKTCDGQTMIMFGRQYDKGLKKHDPVVYEFDETCPLCYTTSHTALWFVLGLAAIAITLAVSVI